MPLATSYADAIEGLLALGAELHTRPGQPRRKFRLEEMRTLMAALGDPQNTYPAILIAGTNGKGSTCATLASILNAAGYKTGRYTSPHLSVINERIEIGGATISNHDFASQYFRVHAAAEVLVGDAKLPAHPSFFETVTALAFLHFAAQRVDIAVLEVGLGGRLDATNIVAPLVSILTDISLDHTEWLGPTISAITREKAGILRRNGVLVTLPQHPEANQVIGEIAVPLGVRAVTATGYLPASRRAAQPAAGSLRNRYTLHLEGYPPGDSIEVDSPLGGMHQERNLALAVAAAVELRNHHGYNINSASMAEGIRNTRWPGRLELFPGQHNEPDVLLDVAHNPAGAWSLRSAISQIIEEREDALKLAQPEPLAQNFEAFKPLSQLPAPLSRPRPKPLSLTLIFGCLADKAVAEMAQILFPLFDRVVLLPVDSPRSALLPDLVSAAETTGVSFTTAQTIGEAWQQAAGAIPPPVLVVVTGSMLLVGAMRDLLLSRTAHLDLPAADAQSGSAAEAQPAGGRVR